MTPNGAIFRTDKPGFLGELMEKYYTDRSKYKKLMLVEQKKLQKDKNNKTIQNDLCYDITIFRWQERLH